MEDRKLKVGDKVRICSEYYDESESNPIDSDGTIRDISHNYYYFLVDWDDGNSNSYLIQDLVLASSKKERSKQHQTKIDPIVTSVMTQLLTRSQLGISKYGTTLEENNTDDFLQHLKEELMDAVLYIEKLQSK